MTNECVTSHKSPHFNRQAELNIARLVTQGFSALFVASGLRSSSRIEDLREMVGNWTLLGYTAEEISYVLAVTVEAVKSVMSGPGKNLKRGRRSG